MIKKSPIIRFEDIGDLKKYISDKKTVLVGGCFDILHYGHLQFLKAAKEAGEYVIVALESDEFIKNKKRKEPIHSQVERAEILAALKYVDAVLTLPLFEKEENYVDLVKALNPTIIAVTEGDPYLEKKKAQAEMIGAEVKVVTPHVKGLSTRKIISEFS